MIGQISTVLAEAKINIAEMINKSKGDYAYNIIDVSVEPTQKVIDAIYKIKGVINVRTFKLKSN